MDPISLLAVVDGSLSLVGKFLKVAKDLDDLASQYKHAELAIVSIVQELDILQLSWEHISASVYTCGADAIEPEIFQRIDRSLKCGVLVMSALEKDLIYYTDAAKSFSSRQRLKSIWDSNTFQSHLNRIRGQAQSMSLLLAVIRLPEAPNRLRMLDQGAALLRKSDESAYSIVPSRKSWSIKDRSSQESFESAELTYRQLNMDDDLFTSRVYKRNYRNPRMVFETAERLPIDQNSGTFPAGKELTHSDRRRPAVPMTTATEKCVDSQIMPAKEYYATKPSLEDFVSVSGTISRHGFTQNSESHENPLLMDDDTGSFFSLEETSSEIVSIDNQRAEAEKALPHTPITNVLWKVEPIEYPYVLGPSAVGEAFTLEGPAISHDLCHRGNRTDSPSIRQSVSCCNPRSLKMLLIRIGSRFARWRKHYFLEACLQRRTPLVHLLLGISEGVGFTSYKPATEGRYAGFIKAFMTWGIKSHTNIIEQHCLLHSAVMCNHEGVVEFLIAEGAQVNHHDIKGSDPIHLACVNGNLNCVRLLVEAGARIDRVDQKGYQPIHYLGAREANDTQDVAMILDVLLLAGAKVDAKTDKDQILLQIACKNSRIDALRAALKYYRAGDLSANLEPHETLP